MRECIYFVKFKIQSTKVYVYSIKVYSLIFRRSQPIVGAIANCRFPAQKGWSLEDCSSEYICQNTESN